MVAIDAHAEIKVRILAAVCISRIRHFTAGTNHAMFLQLIFGDRHGIGPGIQNLAAFHLFDHDIELVKLRRHGIRTEASHRQ